MNIFKKMKVVGIITNLYLKGDFNMKNWKTSSAGLLAAAGQIMLVFGVPQDVCNAVTVIGLFLIGLLAKDHDVTGGKIAQ